MLVDGKWIGTTKNKRLCNIDIALVGSAEQELVELLGLKLAMCNESSNNSRATRLASNIERGILLYKSSNRGGCNGSMVEISKRWQSDGKAMNIEIAQEWRDRQSQPMEISRCASWREISFFFGFSILHR
jgi:hypothetical protein